MRLSQAVLIWGGSGVRHEVTTVARAELSVGGRRYNSLKKARTAAVLSYVLRETRNSVES